MRQFAKIALLVCCAVDVDCYCANAAEKVVDITTRTGVTQRMLVQMPKEPKAAVVLLAGGHGGLQIASDGTCKWGVNNFLIRSRQLFADQGLAVVVVDAPSDRLNPPYLTGFRTTREHVADIKAVIAWVRKEAKVPMWLVGTSRGTESVAFVATQLSGTDGPDGIVLTSTILTDNKETPVTAMALAKVRVPVLVVHHEQDGCSHCSFTNVPMLMDKLKDAPKKQLISVTGGENRGDPCEAFAYHGFNGLEKDVATKIVNWILAKQGAMLPDGQTK